MSSDPLDREARVALGQRVLVGVLTGRGLRDLEPDIAPHHALLVPLPFLAPTPGFRGLRVLSMLIRSATRDMEVAVEDALADGPLVALRFQARFIHSGSFGVERPTFRPVKTPGVAVFRFSPDATDVVESRADWNFFGVLRQIGAVQIRNVVRSAETN